MNRLSLYIILKVGWVSYLGNLSFKLKFLIVKLRKKMFSVVIPLYNKEDFITRAIESVLEQEYESFELIVVDDGSTDGSLDRIKYISDSRIRIINQLNQGVGAARNKGVIESKYEWVAFLDADDSWSKAHLTELFNIINFFPKSRMVATRVLQVYDSKELPITNDTSLSNIRYIDYFYESSKERSVITSSSVAINKKTFKDIGGFSNKKIGEDIEFWVKIALSYPVAISDKITAYYFRDTNGVMQAYAESVKNKSMLKKYSLHNISPAIDFILKESQKDPTILERSNIRLYINTIVLNMVKTSIINKDFSKAKNLSKLALPQIDQIYIYMALYRHTPNILIERIFGLYMKIK